MRVAYGEPDYVPAYSPPEGSSKVDPSQNYTAPPGPPPPAVTASRSERDIAGRESSSRSGAGPSHPPRFGESSN